MTKPVDLVVVGGGTAGIVAAKTAAGFGARVVLIERDRTGGDCLWTGCVPSKALIAAASEAKSVRSAHRFGIEVKGMSVDFERVMEHVHGAIAEIAPIDSPEALRDAGVEVIAGDAVFTGPKTVQVGTRTVTFTQAVVTTGSRPTVPPIDGLDTVDYLTSDTVWDLTALPQRLLVVGGGSIGCELAQAFARLGSTVTLVEGADRILSAEDRTASTVLTAALIADGIDVRTSTSIAAVQTDTATTKSGEKIDFDHILIAVGRTPRTDSLGLDVAGVDVDKKGYVVVDEHLRTTNPRIWAAGDLTGHPQFTHTAGMHGSLAGSNAALGLRRSVSVKGEPRVTYTDPEVASAGIDVLSARDIEGLRLQTLDHQHVDRAVAEGRTAGFATLVIDGKRRIVGATIVGPRAGESIGELVVAIGQGLRTRDLAGATHPYPTYNDGPWNAAIADVRLQLGSPAISRTMKVLTKVRGWWLRRSN